MKRIIFLLCAALLSSCGCILSQIPPQKIYAGAGCSAVLPDYRLKIAASDNCEISSLTQTPAPGFSLSATNKVANVIVKATDASGNFRELKFTVTLLDTIKPKFTIDPSLLAYQVKQVEELYNFADLLLAEQDNNLMSQSWIDSIPGLRVKLGDSTYYKKSLLVWTAKGHAATGYGNRIWTFYDADKDTIILRR